MLAVEEGEPKARDRATMCRPLVDKSPAKCMHVCELSSSCPMANSPDIQCILCIPMKDERNPHSLHGMHMF